jgi:hypothetical protein
MLRVIAGFLIAPAIGLLVLGALLSWPELRLLVVIEVFGAMIAYPSAIMFGLPLFLWLRRKHLLRWWSTIIAGALAGVPAWILLLTLGIGSKQASDILGLLGMVTLVGAVSGGVFWIVGVRGNEALI